MRLPPPAYAKKVRMCPFVIISHPGVDNGGSYIRCSTFVANTDLSRRKSHMQQSTGREWKLQQLGRRIEAAEHKHCPHHLRSSSGCMLSSANFAQRMLE
ncbi:unnamed protein product [Gadus morhua 'NCC']